MLEDKLKEIGDGKKCPIAVIMKDGHILTGLRNYTKDKWKDVSVWTVPGGRSELGETLEQALRREVKEEVNITNLEIVDFIGEQPGAKEGDVAIIFFCKTNQDPVLMEPEKFSEWRWITMEDYIDNKTYAGFSPAARKVAVDFLKSKGFA